jgi:hypothetical protein
MATSTLCQPVRSLAAIPTPGAGVPLLNPDAPWYSDSTLAPGGGGVGVDDVFYPDLRRTTCARNPIANIPPGSPPMPSSRRGGYCRPPGCYRIPGRPPGRPLKLPRQSHVEWLSRPTHSIRLVVRFVHMRLPWQRTAGAGAEIEPRSTILYDVWNSKMASGNLVPDAGGTLVSDNTVGLEITQMSQTPNLILMMVKRMRRDESRTHTSRIE